MVYFFVSVLAFERMKFNFFVILSSFSGMENDAGESVDLYRPRKW
jgi:hypothetical protein